MSLKAIEMQIALPRTQDAGKIQEQLLQKNLIQQDHATHQGRKEEERKQTTVMGEEQKLPAHFYEKEGSADKGPFFKQRRKKDNTRQTTENIDPHPYKGKSIDYSG
ncbi:hypothetical protein ACQKL0_04055 [Peribacillus sp. NPDC097264]|uniref:hypothetical protein n=1 Tax=unclassified Peribacillus TaxID=2675266 RepID=UPI003806B5C9